MTGVALEPVAGRNKAAAVAENIRMYAVAKGAGWKLPPVRDLCRSFNVAYGTLDSALRKLERQGVVERKLGSGVYVSEGISRNTLGVVFGGDIFGKQFSPYWGLLLKAVREQTDSSDSLRVKAYMDISEGHGGLGGRSQLIADLEAGQLQGLLLFALSAHAETLKLKDYGVPIVADSPTWAGNSLPDTRFAILRRSVRVLRDLGAHHVGLISANREDSFLLVRQLRRAGLNTVRVEDWSWPSWKQCLQNHLSPEGGAYQMMRQLIADSGRHPLPDAVVSLDDTLTRGAITAMLHDGLKPGHDLPFVTQSNKGSPVLELFADDLIQIEIDPAVIVRTALGMLETLMAGGTPVKKLTLPEPRLILPQNDKLGKRWQPS